MRLRGTYIRLFCTHILACASVYGIKPYFPQSTDPFLEPWRWDHLEFLDNIATNSLAQAPDGAMWFTSIDAIARYDGLNLDIINLRKGVLYPEDSGKKYPVRRIMVTRDGTPLFLYKYDLVAYKDGEFKILISNLESLTHRSTLHQSPDGNIWLNARRALWRISPNLEDHEIVYSVKAPSSLISCSDQDDNLWIGVFHEEEPSVIYQARIVNQGLEAKGKWILHKPPKNSSHNDDLIIKGLQDGTLAFASSSWRTLAQKYDPKIKKWSPIPLGKHSNSHYSILQTKEGQLLFGSAGVIAAYKASQAEIYRYTDLDIPISPLDIFESFDGRIWVLASHGGVYVIDPTFRNWKTLLGLHFQCEGMGENEWYISNDKRIVYFDKRHEQWFQFEPKDGVIDVPKRITKGPDGTLWALGSHSGKAAASFLDDANQWQTQSFPEIGAVIGKNSYTFLPDGRLVFTNGQAKAVSGTGGVAIIGKSKTNQFKLFEFLRAPKFPEWAYHIERTSDGRIWIANKTIHQIDLEQQTSEIIDKFPHGKTDALINDSNQSLWIAKGFRFGVWEKSPASDDWHAYGKPDGLASNRASGLLALSDGKILASSENGISQYDGHRWGDHAISEHFAITLWEGSEMRKDSNDSLWLNLGRSNTIKHRPNRLLQNLKYYTIRYTPESDSPETTIVSYQKSISPGGNAYVAWSGIDPWEQTHRENLEYSWRLNNTEWTFFSSKKNHTFLALEPGPYTLEVRSRDRNGNIELQPALITFKVDNYIWARPWFVGLVGTLIALTIALILVTIRWREQRLLNEKQRIEEREKHLQEIDQIKTGFVNNISHEINTPLTAMIVPLERITARIESDDRMKRRLNSVINNAHRVKRLVSQLLLFRDIEKGELKLELQIVDLAQLIRRTAESMQVIAEIHQTKLTLQTSNTFPAHTDPDAIEKILHNLISNALKYTQDAGEVIITLGPTDPKEEYPYIRITVEDNGVGISPEFKGYVFDRFYRVPEKSLIDGSGIGLNLTKKLIQQCGGTIEIESPIYESIERPGTRVSVELPRLPIPHKSATKPESPELNPTP